MFEVSRKFAPYFAIALIFSLMVVLILVSGSSAQKNLDNNVQVGITCIVESKTTYKPIKRTSEYFAETSDCGTLEVSYADWMIVDEETVYVVNIHGDDKIQQVGQNWIKQ